MHAFICGKVVAFGIKCSIILISKLLLSSVLFAKKYLIHLLNTCLLGIYYVAGTVLDTVNETDQFPISWNLAYIQFTNLINMPKAHDFNNNS